jgi:hypothetical protein
MSRFRGNSSCRLNKHRTTTSRSAPGAPSESAEEEKSPVEGEIRPVRRRFGAPARFLAARWLMAVMADMSPRLTVEYAVHIVFEL